MKLLVLGGTRFLGRHIVEIARGRGHEVTLFNRGKIDPNPFPDLEHLKGERDSDLAPLTGRRWDAVVDTCGYVPRIVKTSAELLADAVGHYTFISSGSVYEDFTAAADESAPIGTLKDETVEEVTGETYGPLKALCERAAETAMPGRVLHVRAGLIVGPHDPTDRFTYWPHRIGDGGEVLAPGRRDAQVQFVDVRDLSDWIVGCAENGTAGVFNATGPADVLTMESLLETTRRTCNPEASLTLVPDAFLEEQKVGPWMELPLWIPGADLQMICTRAIDAGLDFRPLEDTLRDTLEWSRTRPTDREWRAGMKREREAEVLTAWHATEEP